MLIISGGRVDESFLSDFLRKENFSMIIAADYGLTIADRLNIKPDWIVGDFDSVPEEVITKYSASTIPIYTYPTEKDKTDTEIAIELALEHKATDIYIVGGTGSRIDHTLANIHLLMLPMELQINAFLVDPNNKIYLKNESFTIIKEKQFGENVSLLPFGEQVKGLTLKGFKYPLKDITYGIGSSLGISNEIKEEVGIIEILEGILIVIESRD